jgi:hypothetical protein
LLSAVAGGATHGRRYELVTASSPFSNAALGTDSDGAAMTPAEMEAICARIVGADVVVPPDVSPAAAELIVGLLTKDADKRVGCHPRRGEDQLKATSFLRGLDWTNARELALAVPHLPPNTRSPSSGGRQRRRSSALVEDEGGALNDTGDGGLSEVDLKLELEDMTDGKVDPSFVIDQSLFFGFDWQQGDG